MLLCKYCNKYFKNKYTLLRHQNTSKYCLKIQNNNISIYKCNNCSYNTNINYNFDKHLTICKEKKKYDEKKKRDEELWEVQNKLSIVEKKLDVVEKNNEILQNIVYNSNTENSVLKSPIKLDVENESYSSLNTIDSIQETFLMPQTKTENVSIVSRDKIVSTLSEDIKFDTEHKLRIEAEEKCRELDNKIRELENKIRVISNPVFSRKLENYPNTPVIYLISDPCDIYHRLTYGRTNKFGERAYQYYTSFKCVAPTVHFYRQMTVKETKDIEAILHKIFHNYRDPSNSEWLIGITIKEAICKIQSAITLYIK